MGGLGFASLSYATTMSSNVMISEAYDRQANARLLMVSSMGRMVNMRLARRRQ